MEANTLILGISHLIKNVQNFEQYNALIDKLIKKIFSKDK
jgi:hypothetical protein